jgi:hypothetical protein
MLAILSLFRHNIILLYRMFRAQADLTLTHTTHKGTEQSTIKGKVVPVLD